MYLDLFQVIIGSPDLKANQSINQIIEVMTDLEKYNRLNQIDLLNLMCFFCFILLICLYLNSNFSLQADQNFK